MLGGEVAAAGFDGQLNVAEHCGIDGRVSFTNSQCEGLGAAFTITAFDTRCDHVLDRFLVFLGDAHGFHRRLREGRVCVLVLTDLCVNQLFLVDSPVRVVEICDREESDQQNGDTADDCTKNFHCYLLALVNAPIGSKSTRWKRKVKPALPPKLNRITIIVNQVGTGI
ncbi:hypothetical protein D3C86_1618580 [compost metagenome]